MSAVPPSERWGVVGHGRVGRTFARRLAAQGALQWAWTRTRRDDEADDDALHAGGLPAFGAVDVVLVAVPDDALSRLVEVACSSDPDAASRIWLHTSGVRGAAALRDAGVTGPVGTCHPLASLTGSADDDATLRGAFVAVGGDPAAVLAASNFARSIDARPGVVPDDARVAYHLAAVLASNGVYAVLEAARAVCARAGIESDELTEALSHLALGSARGAWQRGVDDAITGPVSRGDAGTIQQHLAWLTQADPERLVLYRSLAREQLAVAERSGLPSARVRAVDHALATDETGPRPPSDE